jgi:DNA-binding NtrC family response regulator
MSRYIHQKSKRTRGPFIALNCAAIPENLLESELFGHEKGAFTGAVARRIGKFEEANGGTLLLDEITEMPLALQAKLLRAIQERVIDRIGGNTPVKVDIRLIATSNRDLESFVKAGNFREDLYFRLNVMNLALPSLRERASDILPLAQMFADKYGEQNGLGKKKVSAAAAQVLKSHRWPGNIRELENTMHRAVLMSQEAEVEAGAILISGQKAAPAPTVAQTAKEVVSSKVAPGETPALVGRTVADVERELILNTLNHCLGNRTHAANILGISIRTLRNKLKEYGEQETANG